MENLTKVYLASPIFTREQLDLVERLENKAREMRYELFSPRWLGMFERGTDFQDPETKMIVDQNLNYLNDSDKLIAVVYSSERGGRDMGTLWEIGAFIAHNYYNVGNFYLVDYRDIINRLLKSHIFLVGTKEDRKVMEDKILIAFRLFMKIMSLNDQIPANGKLSPRSLLIDRTKITTDQHDVIDIDDPIIPSWLFKEINICIDDRPEELILLIGMLTNSDMKQYGRIINTYTRKGYGSNIMILNSVDNHYLLETIGDDIKMTPLEIEDLK